MARRDVEESPGEPHGPDAILVVEPVGPTGRCARLILSAENALLALFLAALILLACTQILLRNLTGQGLPFGDAAARVLVLWVAMLAAVAGARDNRHINIDVVSRFLPPRARAAAALVVGLFTAAVSALLAWQSLRFLMNDRAAGTRLVGEVPAWVAEAILPLGFALMAGRYLLHGLRHGRALLARRAARHPTPGQGGP